MAQKTINLGTGELTGDGETLRSAFSKANDNFTELYADPGGITDIVQDTTPQLGGNLDMNGFEIVTTAGGHIRLDPDTTGGVGIGNVTNPSTLLHLQQSAPIITLQRLDNALSQGISWTGQAGTEAAHIKLDGTGGTTNTLIMSAFDGASVTERLRIMAASGAGIKVTGNIEVSGRIDVGGSLGIGQNAARTNQGIDAVAVGGISGDDAQGDKAVAVGASAGQLDQGAGAVALGFGAGQNLQAANSIVINATGSVLQNTTASSFVVKPVRAINSGTLPAGFKQVGFNPTTGEIIYLDGV